MKASVTHNSPQATGGRTVQRELRASGDEQAQATISPAQGEQARDAQGRQQASATGSVWAHASMAPGSQTVVVPPLSCTGRQKVGSMAQEELDRSILHQRLGQLEREAKRLRRKLGLSPSAAEGSQGGQGAGDAQPEGQSASLLPGQNGAPTEGKRVPTVEGACDTPNTQSAVATIDLTTTGQMTTELKEGKQAQTGEVQV